MLKINTLKDRINAAFNLSMSTKAFCIALRGDVPIIKIKPYGQSKELVIEKITPDELLKFYISKGFWDSKYDKFKNSEVEKSEIDEYDNGIDTSDQSVNSSKEYEKEMKHMKIEMAYLKMKVEHEKLIKSYKRLRKMKKSVNSFVTTDDDTDTITYTATVAKTDTVTNYDDDNIAGVMALLF